MRCVHSILRPRPSVAGTALRWAFPLLAAGCVAPAESEPIEETEDALGIGRLPRLDVPVVSASVAVDEVVAVQPGWVRARISFAKAGTAPEMQLTPRCAATGADDGSTTTQVVRLDARAGSAVVDLKPRLDLFATNPTRRPCDVTALDVRLVTAGRTLASATKSIGFAMDLPLSHLHPDRLTVAIDRDEAPVGASAEPRRYAAYPPQIFAVSSSSGRVAFVEVEELPARGTLGLRSLATFQRDGAGHMQLVFELGGGAEMYDGWGVDVDRRGVTKDTSGTEESNPSVPRFLTDERWAPSFVADATKPVLRAPPLVDASTYLAGVLDNHRVPRSMAPQEALDVQYDARAHVLRARSGAKILPLESGPIGVLHAVPIGRPVLPHLGGLLTPLGASPGAVGPLTVLPAALGQAPLSIGQAPFAGSVPGVDLASRRAAARSLAITMGPTALASSALASLDTKVTTAFASPLSPDAIRAQPELHTMSGTGLPGASCWFTEPHDGAAGFVKTDVCGGYTGFGCPTVVDPIRPEALAAWPGTDTEVTIHESLSPQLAARQNVKGTCGLHSQMQHYEAVLNRFMEDLGPSRVTDVFGAPVAVPEPRVHLSPGAFLSNLQTHLGTVEDNDDPSSGPDGMPPETAAQLPQFADAYWPAREPFFEEWTKNDGRSPEANGWLSRCRIAFWHAGFCSGQGSAAPGAYRSYSTMVATRGQDPLRDGLWSLVNTYHAIVRTPIALGDKDAAIRAIIAELRKGLPVRIGFVTEIVPQKGAAPYDPLNGGMTWSLPPNIAGCTFGGRDAHYARGNGHYLNVVGMKIVGSPDDPDPFKSLFVLENNWGKYAGYKGYFAMTFAYFKLFAHEALTYRLNRTCESDACANKP